MINTDMKRRRRLPRRMAQKVADPAQLKLLQQLRRDLTQPWDQVDTLSMVMSLGLVAAVLLVLKIVIGA